MRRHGKRRCRWYADSERNSGYFEHNADKLPFGSQRWWDQMLRENRAGNPGGGGRN